MLLLMQAFSLKSQISIGGIPCSFEYNFSKAAIPTVAISKPNITQLLLEDNIAAKNGEAYRMGILLPVNKGIHNSGSWTNLKNGDKIWQLRVQSKDALATAFYFDSFYLPKGSKLFVYNDDRASLIGAFTANNNHKSGMFATSLILGDAAILEYYQPFSVTDTVILNIAEINYAYRGVNNYKYGFGSSESCEVNMNCAEGNNWQLEKKGVCRINIRKSGGTYWCTGSLVNNTLQDYTPYLLTADHCGNGASASDIAQWMFYFNYEATSCSNPSSEGGLAAQSMTGAIKIANGGNSGNTGSDFFLLKLNNNVPDAYNPCFLGWDRSGDSSLTGVSIHHPAGDIKKISTYTVPLVTAAYQTALSHWKVYWSATANGNGVTEGGSSGSPIFNASGRIIGTLTGGQSDCSNPTGEDYYGKFDWHWDKDGSTAAEHLKEWLDPSGSNVKQLNSILYKKVDFEANTTLVKLGSSVNFTNKSIGGPFLYQWSFENGTPATSISENPINISFPAIGFYDVSLKASNIDTVINLTKTDYIRVWDDIKIYVTNSNSHLWVDLGNNLYTYFNLYVFDVSGKKLLAFENNTINQNTYSFNLNCLSSGVYFIRINSNLGTYNKKIVIIRP